jgi:predicted nucleic acid-binding protein
VSPPRLVLVDANVLINLAQADRLDLLGAFPDLESWSPREALSEVTSEPQKTRVAESLERRDLREMLLTEIEDLTVFVDLRRIMGIGEAACLALAVRRGALVASDEKRAFRREAEARLGPGRILNTPGLLLLGIRRGILTLDEADEIKQMLERLRFRMRFESFRDLI